MSSTLVTITNFSDEKLDQVLDELKKLGFHYDKDYGVILIDPKDNTFVIRGTIPQRAVPDSGEINIDGMIIKFWSDSRIELLKTRV